MQIITNFMSISGVREIKYNITIISSIYYLLDIHTDLITNNKIRILYNKFNKVRKTQVAKPLYKYFLEDFWSCSLENFIIEYNKFIQTKQSFLFFKSNLINFAILLCKFKTYKLNNYKSTIHQYNYLPLIESLVNALSCKYIDVFNFYNNFIKFILLYKKYDEYNNFVLNELNDTNKNNLYVYFSLNSVKDYLYARTQYTQFCFSIVNPEASVHERKNISFMIIHDFNLHNVYNRKKQFTQEN